MPPSLLSLPEFRELETGEMTDPFARLGYHHVSVNGKTLGLVRVYNPAFQMVEIELEGQWVPTQSNGKGCFEALFPGRKEFFPYRVRATLPSKEVFTYEDAYAIMPVLTDYDLHLFKLGTHYKIWKKMGANLIKHQGFSGVHFSVWAPNALGVSVIGDHNGWNPHSHRMRNLAGSGVWEIFVPDVISGLHYKFLIHTQGGRRLEKMDPYAKESELRPKTASTIADAKPYPWKDEPWEAKRPEIHSPNAPVSIYEVHLGSWKNLGSGNAFPTYLELVKELVPYVQNMGYTHIELMPIQEHPLDESWGYQVTGFYSPTRRYGSPEDLKTFIEACHMANLGVIMDWVPAHFPSDAHALDWFDGTQLYSHQDPRKGEHPEWGTKIFNYSRHEIANFLIANALYWLEEFHVDGLRVDAVASMIYLDYARKQDEWEPNADGGNTNHEAVEFLKHLNSIVRQRYPHRLLIAEESSSFPGVTRSLDQGGLGFTYKWNLGWMHDFLTYLSKEPIHRKHHQNLLTFEMSYAFTENFMLVLSHDEVVHGKGSLPRKMPGDAWQQFANMRLAFAYMFAHPGKKLHFMGLEFGQESEWNVKGFLEWWKLDSPEGERNRGLQNLVRDLNRMYRQERALYKLDCQYESFQWIDFQDTDQNVISFMRKDAGIPNPLHPSFPETLVCIFNFSPVVRHPYRVGVPWSGYYSEIMNTDSSYFGGSNVGNLGGLNADPIPTHSLPYSVELSLGPLAAVLLKHSISESK